MNETDIFHLISQASLFAQVILATLATILFFVLFFILRKLKTFARVRRSSQRFSEDYWSKRPIKEIHKLVLAGEYGSDGLAMVFLAGWQEYEKYEKTKKAGLRDSPQAVEGVRAAMNIAVQSEIEKLHALLPFLATAGSASPYIGLLGTVWGIINAFRSLTQTVQATIAQVAPGIAEALIATAMGLFAAIPAVIAYNHLSARLEQIALLYDNFAAAFANQIRRQHSL